MSTEQDNSDSARRGTGFSAFVRTRVFRYGALSLLVLAAATLFYARAIEQRRGALALDSRLASEVDRVRGALSEVITRGEQALRLIGDVPPISGIIRASRNQDRDPQSQSSLEQWRTRLAQIFAALLRTDPALSQVRYLAAADGGREIVRVDRRGGKPIIVPRERLQAKGHRPYVKRALSLRAGQIAASDITLNRERGAVETPYRPMLRLATPVFDRRGAIFGVLVINYDFSAVLNAARRSTGQGDLLYLGNQRGEFVAHPDRSVTFGVDRGKPQRFSQMFAGIDRQLAGDRRITLVDRELGQRSLITRLALDRHAGAFLSIAVSASLSRLDALAWRDALQRVLQLGIVGCVGLFLLFLSWSRTQSRLAAHAERVRLAAIVENSYDAVVGIDRAGVITSWNPAAERMFGHRAEEAIGRDVDRLLETGATDDDPVSAVRGDELPLRACEDCNFSCAAKESLACSRRLVSKAGEPIYVSLTSSPIRDQLGNLVGGALILRDIRQQRADRQRILELNVNLERQVAERTRALEQVNALQRSVLAHAGHALIAADLSGVITVFNPAAEKMLGYAAEELVGKATPQLFHVAEEVAQRAAVLSEELGYAVPVGFDAFVAKARLGHVDQNDWTYIRKDGSKISVQLAVTALVGGQGEIFGYLGLAADVTAARQREQALAAARAEAERSSRAKDQFLANMSHEIRTPINGLLGTLQLLRKTTLSTLQRQYLSMASSSGQALLGIVDDLLDVAKIEAGKLSLTEQSFSLGELLESTAAVVSPQIGAKPLRLLYDVDSALPNRLTGDALRLQQVLVNLIGNAIKFSERGEILVTLRSAGVVRAGQPLRLTFSVSDHGIGMSPEEISRVFDGFEQAEATTTRRFGGTGLGLTICRELIRLMGGEIIVESEKGQGSVFRFDIKVTAAADVAPAPEPERASCRRSLLVFDPLVRGRELVRRSGEFAGWTVDQVGELHAIAPLLDAQSYDSVLLRVTRPIAQFVQVLKLLDRSRKPEVICAGSLSDQQQLADAGALYEDFVFEPWTASQLIDAITPGSSDEKRQLSAAKSYGKRLEHYRVLLVEDNPLNQRIAVELLRAEGADVSLAISGPRAIALLADSRDGFDAVLMDLHMPELDGLETTRRIRGELHLTELPIIAMTASNTPADRAACRAAGMVGHIGKPFHIDDVVQALRSLSPLLARAKRISQLVTIGASSSSLPPPSDAGDDFEIQQSVQRFGGNAALWRREAAQFSAQYAEFPAQLKDWLAAGERERLRSELHTLRGLAATLGARALAASVLYLEQLTQVDGAEQSTINAAQQRLAEQLRQAREKFREDALPFAEQHTTEIAAGGSAHSNTEQAALTVEQQQFALRQLTRLLAAHDLAAIQVFEDVGPRLAKLSPHVVASLEAALQRLDFREATRLCEHLEERISEHGA
ncbi:MAG: PAS domain S-box protein [Deltaproteobacteria bacterium]|nr:PAS domain S-box protein [Deltaproteobacteria bacterium]